MTSQIFTYKGAEYSLNKGDELFFSDMQNWIKIEPKNLDSYEEVLQSYENLFNVLRKGKGFSLFILSKDNKKCTIIESTK